MAFLKSKDVFIFPFLEYWTIDFAIFLWFFSSPLHLIISEILSSLYVFKISEAVFLYFISNLISSGASNW